MLPSAPTALTVCTPSSPCQWVGILFEFQDWGHHWLSVRASMTFLPNSTSCLPLVKSKSSYFTKLQSPHRWQVRLTHLYLPPRSHIQWCIKQWMFVELLYLNSYYSNTFLEYNFYFVISDFRTLRWFLSVPELYTKSLAWNLRCSIHTGINLSVKLTFFLLLSTFSVNNMFLYLPLILLWITPSLAHDLSPGWNELLLLLVKAP